MRELTAKDVMSPDVAVVREDMFVRDLANFFSENMITGAPVVDQQGTLRGVVSQSDVVRSNGQRTRIVSERASSDYYLHGWEDQVNEDEIRGLPIEETDDLLVRDIMTPLIFKVTEETTIQEMADVMISGRIHRLIVTQDDQVRGIVTTLDLLKVIRGTLA